MTEAEFNDIHQGYIGAQAMQYGAVDDRLKLLDARVAKLYPTMNGNQVAAIVKAQREARKHARHLHNVEEAAKAKREKHEEERRQRAGR